MQHTFVPIHSDCFYIKYENLIIAKITKIPIKIAPFLCVNVFSFPNNFNAIIVDINQKGISKYNRFLSTNKPKEPDANAPTPRENIGSVMFDPIKVPIEISPAFSLIARIAVVNSGKPVPTPITEPG